MNMPAIIETADSHKSNSYRDVRAPRKTAKKGEEYLVKVDFGSYGSTYIRIPPSTVESTNTMNTRLTNEDEG